MSSPFTYVFPEYSVIQTFYVDREAVNFVDHVYLTSVEVFFKTKPAANRNLSGYSAPGCVVSLCEVSTDAPVTSSIVPGSIKRLDYDSITANSTNANTATKFTFPSPVRVQTNKFYGLIVKFDDPSYDIWTNKQGDNIVGSSQISPGSSLMKDGKLFKKNNSAIYRPVNDTDLKFKVNVAKFTSNTANIEVVNDDYEFFTIENKTGSYRGGETVYRNVANATGTISFSQGNTTLVGNGTTFNSISVGSYIVGLNANNTSNAQVFRISSIANNTQMVVDRPPAFTNTASNFKISSIGTVYYADGVSAYMYLANSSANTTNKFTVGDQIVGEVSGAYANIATIDNYRVDQFTPHLDIVRPSIGTLASDYTFAYSNGSAYLLDTDYARNLNFSQVNNIDSYQGYIQSRSLEADNTNLYGSERKSALIRLTFGTNQSNSNLFDVPALYGDAVNIFVDRVRVSNAYLTTDANSVSIDSEVENRGLALSRHVSRKVNFANNRFAEDIRVFLTGYRPLGTDIRVYAKIHNSADPENFDDKKWTPLEIKDNADRYSSLEDGFDLVEYEYGLPLYHETANTLPGLATGQSSNNVVLMTNDPTSYVAADDLIKLYNPLLPDNYWVGVVGSANSTSITLTQPVTNNNVVGLGMKVDRLKYYNSGFNNIMNDNVSRYYNSSMVSFDKFDSMQIKIVLLADNSNKFPKVDVLQAIGVSA